jgi:predicted ATPase/DNA-binding XRE family transcriptional regulator
MDEPAIATGDRTRHSFGVQLRRARSVAGLTQEELAERAGLTPNAISALERGEHRHPYPATVRALAAALELTAEERAALAASVPKRGHAAVAAEPPVLVPTLPASLSPLIGREAEVATVVALLRRDGVRLVTLTGPGGVGKTRLALHVAAALSGDFADGAAFVPLAAVRDPALVASAMAQLLGLAEFGSRSVIDRLADALRARNVLVLLDNLEHLLDAAPLITDLLARCADLVILATSRRNLRLAGEYDVPVPPLALPDPHHFYDAAHLAEVAAIRLFVERGRAVDPAFRLTAENAATVASICARLDGLPLAIELAAARSRLFPPAALLPRLARRLPLLTAGRRDGPTRHQTMRDAIAWSYDLLTETEQDLFGRLGVFVGGLSLEAAVTVADDGEERVLDGVAALVDHHLLGPASQDDGEPRFIMLETVREYALERLESSGTADEARQRHAAWCLALAEQAEPQLLGPEQTQWLRRLATEHDNLRAALAWAADQPDDALLRLAVALIRFWRFRSLPSEGQRWLERALVRGMSAAAPLRARALLGAGIMASMRRNFERARDYHTQALLLYQAHGDAWGTANALFHLGDAVGGLGDSPQASRLFTASLALFRALGEWAEAMLPLKDLGRLAREAGDYERARVFLEEALALSQQTGFSWGAAETLLNLGQVATAEGDWERAAELLMKSLELYQDQGDQLGIASNLQALAAVAVAQDMTEQATTLLGAASVLYEDMGLSWESSDEFQLGRGLTAARARLGEQAFAVAWEAGRGLPSAQAHVAAQALASLITGQKWRSGASFWSP